ncbi:MAG: hypothetical protein NXI32_04680 [bacterium]|nr:hypothetical protein [bacterium]
MRSALKAHCADPSLHSALEDACELWTNAVIGWFSFASRAFRTEKQPSADGKSTQWSNRAGTQGQRLGGSVVLVAKRRHELALGFSPRNADDIEIPSREATTGKGGGVDIDLRIRVTN